MNSEKRIENYLVVPLYNVRVETKFLNKKFMGHYKIVSTQDFHKYYINKLMDDNKLLATDVLLPLPGKAITRLFSFYVLIKKLKTINNGLSEENYIHNEKIQSLEIRKLDSLITSLRLSNPGNIQINSIYFLSNKSFYRTHTYISTSLSNIERSYKDKTHDFVNDYYFDDFIINDSNIKKAKKFLKTLLKLSDRLEIPLYYFAEYYANYNLTDKLIKLATIWETTILSDRKDALTYVLGVRISYILKKDLSKISNLAYNLRSSLIHTGWIKKDLLKKLNKILNKEYSTTGALVNFIKEYLEPITRSILNSFMQIMIVKEEKFTLSQIAQEIDQYMLNKLTCKTNKIDKQTK